MEDLVKLFANWYVFFYLILVSSLQLAYAGWRRWQRHEITKRRSAQGLPNEIVIYHAQHLAERRRDALLQSGLLLGSIIIVPFILIMIAHQPESRDPNPQQTGVVIVFVSLLLWMVFNGTDVAKAFLGGLAFKTLAAFKNPFQVGDRVTLKDINGKVMGFDTFFVTLQTPNDDQISIPTASLWSEVLNSSNAGDRSSLCVTRFYLAPHVGPNQRQASEDAIWDAIQASVYCDPTKPMQILINQLPDAIQLTAKAYVASTYDEPLFISDVSRAFLDFAARQGIALAAQSWRAPVEFPKKGGPAAVDFATTRKK